MISSERMGIKQLLRSQIVLVTGSWGLEMGDISLRNLRRSPLAPLKKGGTGLSPLTPLKKGERKPPLTPLEKGGNGLSPLTSLEKGERKPPLAPLKKGGTGLSSLTPLKKQERKPPLTPLKKGGTGEEVLGSCVSYSCAVALQLAPRWGIAAGEIAEKLVLELGNFQVLEGQNFEVQAQVMDQGIISLGINDRALAHWLENLRLSSFPCRAVDPQVDPKIINYFPIQSAHARCCSLLKLAARENLIQLQEKPRDQLLTSWQIYLPSEIPWLDPRGKFSLVTPQEQYLVNLLVNLVDEFDSRPDFPQNQTQLQKWEKLATEISLGFANFDRYSRIFGEVRANNLPLAQARLGLVALTRWGLERLLREYLGAIAPPEL